MDEIRLTTWRELISIELRFRKDEWKNVEKNTLTDEELDNQFDNSSGRVKPFVIWTDKYIYFSVYDGLIEICKSLPRHPIDEYVPDLIL